MNKSRGNKSDNNSKASLESAATPNTPSDEQSLTLVGIGASAGGLEAITGLLPNLPLTGNLAVAIIQHRGKEDSSLMPSLLQKTTEMEVVEIQDGMKIKPNHVYLNPPHKEVSIQNQTFYLSDYQDKTGPSLPIDTFFKSLAKQFMKRAVCIIVSGTASDGTHGLMAVKEAGGLTIVQDINQAKYKGMPQSAIDTHHVDMVLGVEEMGPQITKYINHPFQKDTMTEKEAEVSENWLAKICEIIRKRTGHDFSGYRTSTLKRRIQKRMAMHQITDSTDYIHFLEEDQKEVEALFGDALITVTSFFRDPQAWQSLRDNAIKKMIEKRSCTN